MLLFSNTSIGFYRRTNLGRTCGAPGPPIRMLFIAEGLFGSEFI